MRSVKLRRRDRHRHGRDRVTEVEIAEYLAKKAQKRGMQAAKKLKSQTILVYYNDSNPFGDANLNEKFVWRKKIERDVAQGVPLDTFSVKAGKKRQKERMAEIEKVKRRREERALEKARHEEEMALLARERARAEFQDWEKKEMEFHFHQSKVRSEIRLREGRMKPIDVLSNHLNGSDDMDVELNEPYMVFKGLTVKETEELRDDIQMHLDLDRATPTHTEYWEALVVLCDWELAEARKKDALDRARVRGEQPPAELLAQEWGLHSSIEVDVKNLLEGKTYHELEALQSQIESQMRTGTAKEVVEYWEAVLKHLHISKAMACLKEIHAKILPKHEQLSEGEDRLQSDHSDDHDVKDAETYSPEPILQEEIEIHEVDDSDHHHHDPMIMPKYFNRFHTGYEWNKYNQTHYDHHDSPPPKIVQGYKFNIFYPDLLLDKTKAPLYTIEKDGNSSETCIIRFRAGPPYEDIAFRIVNREWEYSRKKGFKCTFERGILRLYFNFKRYRYRR